MNPQQRATREASIRALLRRVERLAPLSPEEMRRIGIAGSAILETTEPEILETTEPPDPEVDVRADPRNPLRTRKPQEEEPVEYEGYEGLTSEERMAKDRQMIEQTLATGRAAEDTWMQDRPSPHPPRNPNFW